ncbi:MAG: condensation domain-containing protein, partial [Stackebrandtia sp.]
HHVLIPAGSDASGLTVDDLAPQTVASGRLADRLRDSAEAAADGRRIAVSGFETADGETVLLLTLDASVCDRESAVTVMRDLRHAYLARSAGRSPVWWALPVGSGDHARRPAEPLESQGDPDAGPDRRLAQWRERLDGWLPAKISDGVADRADLVISAEAHGALRQFVRRHRASAVMVVEAALAVALRRMGIGPELLIGHWVSGRTGPALIGVVGRFSRWLPLRVTPADDLGFADLVDAVKAEALTASVTADLPFDRVMRHCFGRSDRPVCHGSVRLLRHGDPTVTAPEVDVLSMSGTAGVELWLRERFDADGLPAGIDGWVQVAAGLGHDAAADAVAAELVETLGTELSASEIALSEPSEPVRHESRNRMRTQRYCLTDNGCDTPVGRPRVPLPHIAVATH